MKHKINVRISSFLILLKPSNSQPTLAEALNLMRQFCRASNTALPCKHNFKHSDPLPNIPQSGSTTWGLKVVLACKFSFKVSPA